MFKKALKIAVSFCLLVGAYAGYTRLFAVITEQLGVVREDVGVPFLEFDSRSALRATELARESFGPESFAAGKDLKLQYYEAARGFYMYAQEKEILKDGKQIHVKPFAIIWLSKDGKSRKMATSDEAWIDLSQPFMSVKPSNEPSRVKHVKLQGEVRLRDDKGTLADLTDDLRVGPLAQVEFDDTTLQITTELDAEIFLQERDLTLTGIGMMIQLRRKGDSPGRNAGDGGPSGFDAETAHVYKDVHLVVNDVTNDGVLPGAAKPEKTGKTPIDVRSDREMLIRLPLPHPQVLVGPPNLVRPPDPTFVTFTTNVRVLRGTDKSDELLCNTLDLTLMPDPKKPDATDEEGEDGMAIVAARSDPGVAGQDAAGMSSTPSDGPMTQMKIRSALARGDAVWLRSEVQGMIARCVELKYEKHAFEGLPDITYLNGGSGKKLSVEKVEYDTKSPVPGTVKSIMRMIALDATIFDSGPDGSSRVIARGPGKTEERPARNASVARTAWWEDEMELLTWHDGLTPMPKPSPLAVRALSQERPAIARGTLRRLLTLSGVSKLVDHTTSTTLDARKSIVAEFQAEPNPAPLKGEGPNQIKWLDAYEDAHLTAPSKALTARAFLKAKFETPPSSPMVAAPVVAASGIAPVTGPVPVVVAASPTTTDPGPEPAPAPVEPLVDGRAEHVWATVLLGANGGGVEGAKSSKGELKDAKLRGGVIVHQDPAPGKIYGSDASGEALDLTSQGNGLMKFVVKREEPQAFDPKTKLASATKGRRSSSAVQLARVDFEGKTIECEDIIWLDQTANLAHAQGAGIFTQMTEKGLLDDRGLEGDKERASVKSAGPNPKDKLAITWTDEMWVHGKSADLEVRAAAKIEFRGTSKEVRTPDGKVEFRRGVEAKMTDSAIFTDSMDVYMDRTIDFSKNSRKPAAGPGEPPAPDPQIAMLDCKGKDIVENALLKYPGVAIISQKLFPENGELKEKQRIQGQHVIYDKRTGDFYAPGPGLAWLYRRKSGEVQPEAPIPTSRPVPTPTGGRGRSEVVVTDKKLPPLELTKIKFSDGMRGRFGVAREQAERERRDAEFYGSVQAVNATVAGPASDISFDNLDRRPDCVFLTSDVLNVFSYPSPAGSKIPDKQLLNARGNGLARANFDTIQADRITYNSATGLAYAYGDDGKEVSYAKQDSPGQAPNTTRGNMFLYNKNTHQGKFDDPNAIRFTDLKTGIRTKSMFPELGGTLKLPDPLKPVRSPLQKQGRNSTERNGFVGH